MVVSWNSSNCPLTKRSTRLDLPTAMSPSSTSLNWQILVCGSVPLERPPLPLEVMVGGPRVGDGRVAGPPPRGRDSHLHSRSLGDDVSGVSFWGKKGNVLVWLQDYITVYLRHTLGSFSVSQTSRMDFFED